MQMPNAVSKNNKSRHNEHTIKLIGPTTFLSTTKYSMVAAKTKPMLQAKRFCGAPVHSGNCLRTIHSPRIITGAKRGFMKMRIVNSIKKQTTNTRVGWKFPMSQAFMKLTTARKNRMPAAARTARSFRTGTAYSGRTWPNSKILDDMDKPFQPKCRH